jgi:hypothetical protein
MAKGNKLTDKATQPFDGWENVDEVKAGFDDTFSFDEHGDNLIGIYDGLYEVGMKDGSTAIAAVVIVDNDRIGVWANHDLKQKLGRIETGKLVRIEYNADREVHKGLTAMKEFSVKAK